MGEVQFLNHNHFNYRLQRPLKDLCWWDQRGDKATKRQITVSSRVLLEHGLTGGK